MSRVGRAGVGKRAPRHTCRAMVLLSVASSRPGALNIRRPRTCPDSAVNGKRGRCGTQRPQTRAVVPAKKDRSGNPVRRRTICLYAQAMARRGGVSEGRSNAKNVQATRGVHAYACHKRAACASSIVTFQTTSEGAPRTSACHAKPNAGGSARANPVVRGAKRRVMSNPVRFVATTPRQVNGANGGAQRELLVFAEKVSAAEPSHVLEGGVKTLSVAASMAGNGTGSCSSARRMAMRCAHVPARMLPASRVVCQVGVGVTERATETVLNVQVWNVEKMQE